MTEQLRTAHQCSSVQYNLTDQSSQAVHDSPRINMYFIARSFYLSSSHQDPRKILIKMGNVTKNKQQPQLNRVRGPDGALSHPKKDSRAQ